MLWNLWAPALRYEQKIDATNLRIYPFVSVLKVVKILNDAAGLQTSSKNCIMVEYVKMRRYDGEPNILGANFLFSFSAVAFNPPIGPTQVE